MKRTNVLLSIIALFLIIVLSSCSNKYVVGTVDKCDVKTIKFCTVKESFWYNNKKQFKERYFEIEIDFTKKIIKNTRSDNVKNLSDEENETILNIFDRNGLFKQYDDTKPRSKMFYYRVVIGLSGNKIKYFVRNTEKLHDCIYDSFIDISKTIGYDLFNDEDNITGLTLSPTLAYSSNGSDSAIALYDSPQLPILYNYGNFVLSDVDMFDYVNNNQKVCLPTSDITDISAVINVIEKYLRFRHIIVKQYSIDYEYECDITPTIDIGTEERSTILLYYEYTGNVTFSVLTNKYYHIYFEDIYDNTYEFMISTIQR